MAKPRTQAAKSSDQLVAKLKKQISDSNALWEAKYKVLKGQLKAVAEESYIHGYRDAIMDQTKLDEAFDKHMEVAASEFERMHLKKLKLDSKAKSRAKSKAKKSTRRTRR